VHSSRDILFRRSSCVAGCMHDYGRVTITYEGQFGVCMGFCCIGTVSVCIQ
jgi:hypothetical protein